MEISKIKLGQLGKNSIGDNMMNHLKGAEYYCYFGPENRSANEHGQRCSCYCSGFDYYDTSMGIEAFGDFIRVNWDN